MSLDSDSSTDSSDGSSDDTDYDTEDEAFSEPIAANLAPVPGQIVSPGQPITLDVCDNEVSQSNLPLCILFNARSVYNKVDNLTQMLNQIGPDFCIISETFERQKKQLKDLLEGQNLKYISYFRKIGLLVAEARLFTTKTDFLSQI